MHRCCSCAALFARRVHRRLRGRRPGQPHAAARASRSAARSPCLAVAFIVVAQAPRGRPRSSRSEYPDRAPRGGAQDRGDRARERQPADAQEAAGRRPAAWRARRSGWRRVTPVSDARPAARTPTSCAGPRGSAACGWSARTASRCSPTRWRRRRSTPRSRSAPAASCRGAGGGRAAAARAAQAAARARAVGAAGDRRVLEDLHARGLRDRAVPQADVRAGRAAAGADLPVPLLDVRSRPRAARCIFGPAGRPLPQLPLTVGSDGVLRAGGNFSGQVGPSWWRRAQPEADLDPPRGRLPGPRTGASPFLRKTLRYAFPDHWSFLLGEVALYAFVVLVGDRDLPDALLRAEPRQDHLPRRLRAAGGDADEPGLQVGGRHLLRAQGRACCSARPTTGRRTSSSPSIILHLIRVFFTGAFRRPRSSSGRSA